MESRSPFDWIQLTTLIGIFIGLGMVVFEMRQTQVLARAQLSSDAWAEALAEDRAFMGENPALALEKSCAGEALSREEKVQVFSYLLHLMRRAERLASIEEIGEFGIPVDEATDSLNKQLLGVPLGKELYESHGGFGQPFFKESANSILEEGKFESLYCLWLGSDRN